MNGCHSGILSSFNMSAEAPGPVNWLTDGERVEQGEEGDGKAQMGCMGDAMILEVEQWLKILVMKIKFDKTEPKLKMSTLASATKK